LWACSLGADNKACPAPARSAWLRQALYCPVVSDVEHVVVMADGRDLSVEDAGRHPIGLAPSSKGPNLRPLAKSGRLGLGITLSTAIPRDVMAEINRMLVGAGMSVCRLHEVQVSITSRLGAS